MRLKVKPKTEAKHVSTSPAPEKNSINLVYENGEISSAKLQASENTSQYYLSNYLILDPEKLTERTEMTISLPEELPASTKSFLIMNNTQIPMKILSHVGRSFVLSVEKEVLSTAIRDNDMSTDAALVFSSKKNVSVLFSFEKPLPPLAVVRNVDLIKNISLTHLSGTEILVPIDAFTFTNTFNESAHIRIPLKMNGQKVTQVGINKYIDNYLTESVIGPGHDYRYNDCAPTHSETSHLFYEETNYLFAPEGSNSEDLKDIRMAKAEGTIEFDLEPGESQNILLYREEKVGLRPLSFTGVCNVTPRKVLISSVRLGCRQYQSGSNDSTDCLKWNLAHYGYEIRNEFVSIEGSGYRLDPSPNLFAAYSTASATTQGPGGKLIFENNLESAIGGSINFKMPQIQKQDIPNSCFAM